MFYLIKETLAPASQESIRNSPEQYVAVLSSQEWVKQKDRFDMVIDIEPDSLGIHTTKAEVNYDSLTGSFCIPDRKHIAESEKAFAFALDEKGIVLIDDSGAAQEIVNEIIRTKKWRFPSLERFLYDFLEQIVQYDREMLERYDDELDAMEVSIVNDADEIASERLNDIRSIIRYLRIHYEQLSDFSQELEENENDFFKDENLRYFRLFSNRIDRLRDAAVAISDHTKQVRDIYISHLDIRQNRIMTVLTVVTTVFMPLTLIAGWYGMNFRHMPELESEWGYPVVILASLFILCGSLFFFRKKKWL